MAVGAGLAGEYVQGGWEREVGDVRAGNRTAMRACVCLSARFLPRSVTCSTASDRQHLVVENIPAPTSALSRSSSNCPSLNTKLVTITWLAPEGGGGVACP